MSFRQAQGDTTIGGDKSRIAFIVEQDLDPAVTERQALLSQMGRQAKRVCCVAKGKGRSFGLSAA